MCIRDSRYDKRTREEAERVFVKGFESLGGGVDWKDAKPLQAVSYTHLRAHETPEHLVCRLLLEKKKKKQTQSVDCRQHLTRECTLRQKEVDITQYTH